MVDDEIGLRISLKDRKVAAAGLKELQSDLKGVGDAADQAGRKAQTSSRRFDGLRSGLGTLGRGVGVVTGLLGAAGVAAGVFGVKASAGIETATMNLTTLTGSAKTATTMVKQLTKYGNATTFDTQGLAEAAQQLLTYGINAKDVLPDIKMLGDISMGNQEKLSGLAYVFAQVQGNGHLMGQDLLQMINNGFNPLTNIAKRTGKSMAELRTEMSKGKISFAQVQQAMVDATKKGGQFYNGAKNGANTLAGAWGNLTGSISSTLGNALLPAIKAVEPSMSKLGDFVSSHQKQINRFVKSTVGFITGTTSAVSGFVSKHWGQIKSVVGNVVSFGTKAVNSVRGFISGLGSGGGGSQLSKTFGSVKTFVSAMLPTLKDFGQQLKTTLGPGIQRIAHTFTSQFLPAFRKILPVITPVAKFLLKMFGGAVIGTIKGAIKVIDGVLKAVSGLFNLIADIAHGRWSKIWGDIKQILGGALEAILGAIQVWWNIGILGIFKKGFLFLTKDMWVSGWNGLKSLASRGMTWVKDAIAGGFRSVFDAVKTAWSYIKGDFTGGLGGIRAVLGRVGEVISYPFRAGFRTVRSGFDSLVGFVKGVPSRITKVATGMFDSVKDAAKVSFNGVAGLWNGTVGKISFHVPGWVPKIGGKGWSIPDIPLMDAGGIVQGPGLVAVGPIREQLTPLTGPHAYPTVSRLPSPTLPPVDMPDPDEFAANLDSRDLHVHLEVDGREIGHATLHDFDNRVARR